MAISRSDVGCWVVKCNPSVWDYFGGRAETGPDPQVRESTWSMSRSSARPALVGKGDLIALWVTGPKTPGVHEIGVVTSDGVVDRPEGFDVEHAVDLEKIAAPCLGVEFTAVRLTPTTYVPRSEIVAVPALQRCEQIRAPRMPNPGYLTHDETAALTELVAARVDTAVLARVGWGPQPANCGQMFSSADEYSSFASSESSPRVIIST
ncbi:hypothetical protein [Rhodococcus triatomae]